MEILPPRSDSLRRPPQLGFLFGSNLQPAPQAQKVSKALLGQGTRDFLQCFKTDTEQEITTKPKKFLRAKAD